MKSETKRTTKRITLRRQMLAVPRLRALKPGQKIFLATGSGFFTEAAARHAGFSALLNKPFPFSLLKQALAENHLDRNEKNSADLITT